MEFAIKDVSTLVGLSRRTLRYYESVGLLPEPDRTYGNYRVYSEEDVIDLLRIKRLAWLGFSLAEVRQIIDDPSGGESAELLRSLDATLAAGIQTATDKREEIAEVLRTGAPIEVAAEFAEQLVLYQGSFNDPAGLIQLEVDLVASLGDSAEAQRLKMRLTEPIDQQDRPEYQALIELDRRFYALSDDPPAAELEALTGDYVEALTPVFARRREQGAELSDQLRRLALSLTDNRHSEAQVAVMHEVRARLAARLGDAP
jgi:DNA-binding transcriptional MerR regulator